MPKLRLATVTVAVWLLLPPAFLSPTPASAQSGPVTLADELIENYRWRNLGPDRGGRSIAVSGVVGQPEVGYFGAVGGGLWKTVNGGEDWLPITDFKITSASVGAVAVSETDPDLVFIGTGETCIRGNILPGDGVYRSRDAGETWEHVGFRESHGISKIRVHPTDPDIIWVASFGKYSAPSQERGVFKSTDGGDTWRRVLFANEWSGAIDIAVDRNNPDVLYASLWRAYRMEYTMSSGGDGSGMYKSTDGGESWTEITRAPGMPQEGTVGRIGLAVSSANSDRVYALFEHDSGGLFRSDDAGATWELVNDNRQIRQRAFYYTHVFADHQDEDVVYLQNTGLYKSTDGGESYESIGQGTHGDHHDFWIDPDDPNHLIDGNDGGGAVSFVEDVEWSDQEFSTAQFYHAVTTDHVPFHVCGSQQDNSTLCLPSDWNRGRRTPGTQGSMNVAYRVGGGEPGYIAPDPKDLNVFFSGTNNGRYVDRYNRTLGLGREVNPYPWFYSGEPAIDMVERWQWTFPIVFSPLDENTLFVSSNRLWKTTDNGNSWEQLSPDLTRADPSTLGHSGGPITGDMNGPEVYATIFSVGPSKVDIDVIWTGSDDGLVHVTRDGGESWTDVTPPDMPDFGRVTRIDASAFGAGRAYMSAKLPLLDDFRPYVWKTEDYGQTWTKITNGMRDDDFVNAVSEDPYREGLLYAGTNHGVYISYDDGGNWQQLNPGLPDVPVVDVLPEEDELVIGTHGRGFWVLDNAGPLRQATPGMIGEELSLFAPAPAVRSAREARIVWWSRDEPADARLEILSGDGELLRTVMPADTTEERDRWSGDRLDLEQGLNEFEWDLRIDPAPAFPGMILWGVRTLAPRVPPGTYVARLTVDGNTQSQEFEVRAHPWITDVTQADMEEQYAFGRQIQERVIEANSAVIAIRRMRQQLDERREESDDAALAEAAERLRTNSSEVEANIYQVRNRSGQDPLNFPIKVNNRLANLLSMVERGDGAPNDGMREIFEIMVEELSGYTTRLDEVWRTDLAAVNRELSRLGLDPIDPSDPEVQLISQ